MILLYRLPCDDTVICTVQVSVGLFGLVGVCVHLYTRVNVS